MPDGLANSTRRLNFLQIGHLHRLFQSYGPVGRSIGRNIRIISQLWYRSCHNKCIGARYADGDLNKGESVCIDRCVIKFSETQKKVQDKLQARAQAHANPGGSAGGFGAFWGQFAGLEADRGLTTSFKAKLHCMHLIHKILDLAICQNYKYTAFTKILIASSCRSIDWTNTSDVRVDLNI